MTCNKTKITHSQTKLRCSLFVGVPFSYYSFRSLPKYLEAGTKECYKCQESKENITLYLLPLSINFYPLLFIHFFSFYTYCPMLLINNLPKLHLIHFFSKLPFIDYFDIKPGWL